MEVIKFIIEVSIIVCGIIGFFWIITNLYVLCHKAWNKLQDVCYKRYKDGYINGYFQGIDDIYDFILDEWSKGPNPLDDDRGCEIRHKIYDFIQKKHIEKYKVK